MSVDPVGEERELEHLCERRTSEDREERDARGVHHYGKACIHTSCVRACIACVSLVTHGKACIHTLCVNL